MPFALAGMVALLTLAPLVQLVTAAFAEGVGAVQRIVVRPRTLELLGGTVTLTLTVAVLALALGIAVAFASTRVRLPLPQLWPVLACLPLAVPSFVGAFAWVSAFPTLTGFWPLVLVLTISSVPLVTVPAIGAFALADESLADVARTLGRGRLAALVGVTLPQVLPAALAGTLLVALYTLSDFGAPAILRHQTLTTGVYALFSGGVDRTAAAGMSLPIVALALACIWGERMMRPRAGAAAAAVRRRPQHVLSRRGTVVVASALAGLAALSLLGPLAALTLRMLRADRYGSTPVDLIGASATSMGLAAVAATATVLVALPVGYLAARYRGRIVGLIESVSMLGYALPGVVVALALVALTLAVAPGAYQSLGALIAAQVVLSLPVAVGSTRAAFGRVAQPAIEVSRALGRGPALTWLRVSVRGSLPGLAAGWVLVAAEVMKELPATLMLRPIGVDTLATELWAKTTLGAYGAAAPIGILLVLVGVGPALLLARSVAERVER